jgi:hypothetical protein
MEEKKRKNRGVMNSVSDIEKRVSEVDKLAMFGISAMGFPDKISTVRGVMMSRHGSQRVVLSQPEFARVFTGAENNFGSRSSWDIKAKDDYQLMKTFRKFKNSSVSPVAYIFKNLRTGKYLCKVVKPAHNLVEKYGFQMSNEIAGKYTDGDVIPKGTTISQSTSYVNDNYCAGRNLRLMYTVLPELTEDALLISDTAADALEYNMVDKVKVKISKNAFLRNKYGDKNVYKAFPDVGEWIKDDVICSIRENSYMSSRAEAAVAHINDTNYHSHGIIVDIDIFTNIEVENEQFNYYYSQIREWYSEIYSYISTIVVDKTQDDCSLLDIYHQAEKYLNDSTWVTKEYIVDTEIEFTVLQPTIIKVGQKVVGRYGNKSVVAQIIPHELMPRTEDGRPVDMIANGLAIPNRIIAFALYEASMTFQMERMWQHVIAMHENNEPMQDIMDTSIEFVNVYNHEQAAELARLYHENPHEVYDDIIKNGFYIQIPPLGDICIRDAIIEAYEKWPNIMRRYHIQTKVAHRWVELDGEYAIGYQYTWVLKQEPSKAMSAISTGRTTLYDLPVKTRQFNKNLIRYSDNPIKFGEYDTYNFLTGVGVRAFAKITTYFRGSQYEDNSILMSQLNDVGVDMTKYNKFPQLDNLKNVLKFMGTKLKPDVFNYGTISNIDELHEVLINNVKVNIDIPTLHYILIMHSYYLQYQEYKNGIVDMLDFFENMKTTKAFEYLDNEKINSLCEDFLQLLPILQQLKQYD